MISGLVICKLQLTEVNDLSSFEENVLTNHEKESKVVKMISAKVG